MEKNGEGESPSGENFEKHLHDLEVLVVRLESGELSLDEGLALFEKGAGLYKKCKLLLDSAEKKVTKLTEDLKEDDFE